MVVFLTMIMVGNSVISVSAETCLHNHQRWILKKEYSTEKHIATVVDLEGHAILMECTITTEYDCEYIYCADCGIFMGCVRTYKGKTHSIKHELD